MGRRSSVLLHKLNTNTTLAGVFQTTSFNTFPVDNVGFIIECNSVTDNTGIFTVEYRGTQGRNEDSFDRVTPWVELTLESTIQLADAAQNFLVNLNQIVPGEVRLVFNPSAGSPDGTCNIWVTGTAVGA